MKFLHPTLPSRRDAVRDAASAYDSLSLACISSTALDCHACARTLGVSLKFRQTRI
jgi:hypothetical protein